MEEMLLKNEEKVVLKLRSLYRRYGYGRFKMKKFEEYDLYGQNKDFLVSDGVITFTDTNGRLMALKPDVTLSIVKNYRRTPGCVDRVYYNENVYRISERTHGYREIMQTGLECMGDITEYNLFEVTRLAAASLNTISEEGALNLSHLGILQALLRDVESEACRSELLQCIGDKNAHGVGEVCAQYALPEASARRFQALTKAYGAAGDVAAQFRSTTDDPEILRSLELLERVAAQADTVPGVQVRVDLSLTGDMNYYNGLIFQGFVRGIPASVLRGGQYDRLMSKMGKDARAVGFAVYLDLLERLDAESAYDVDVLLMYDPQDDPAAVQRRIAQWVESGKSVSAQTARPEKLTYRTLETFRAQ